MGTPEHDEQNTSAMYDFETAEAASATPLENNSSSHKDQQHDVEADAGLSKVESGPAWSSFGPWEKKAIIGLASLGAFFSPMTTNIYFPALNDIASDLHVSINEVNLSITTYMIFQGIAPSFMGSFADEMGRRPAYVIGFFIYVIANIGLALNNSYAGLMVLRCIQSTGSSGIATMKIAIICDVITSAERGSYIAFTSVGAILGPSISPIIGGLLAEYKGWHWIFWFLVILSCAFFIPLLLFFPETCRRIVGDGSIPPPKWNKSLLNVRNERRQKKAGEEASQEAWTTINTKQKRKRQYPNPIGTIRLMCEKETALILLFGALIYAGFYAVATSITTQFSSLYHLSSTFTGLLFLPQAVGSICAAFTNGKLLDWNYRRHAKQLGISVQKKKQHSLIGFPIERARLEIGIPCFCVGAFTLIAYGWFLQYKVHIAGPIVMLFIQGYVTVGGFSTMSVLVEDIHRTRAATASAASNLSRCLLGAGASAVVNPMIEAMGQGWCFTFIALVWLASVPILIVVQRRGQEWRKEKQEEGQQKEREREEREQREKLEENVVDSDQGRRLSTP